MSYILKSGVRANNVTIWVAAVGGNIWYSFFLFYLVHFFWPKTKRKLLDFMWYQNDATGAALLQ